MKKFMRILVALSVLSVLIIGCPNSNTAPSLSKAEVQGMIDTSKTEMQAQVDALTKGIKDPQWGNILETELLRVVGKEWLSKKNTTAAGGRADSGYMGKLYFDAKQFKFTSYLLDGGVKSAELSNNTEFANYTNVSAATNEAGANTFTSRLYIKAIHLPLLQKHLSYKQKHQVVNGGDDIGDINAENSDGVSTVTPDVAITHVDADDPMVKYFIDNNAHAGLPNIVIDAEVEIGHTGTDKFQRGVDALSIRSPVRFVIINGNLQLAQHKHLATETGSMTEQAAFRQLLWNYYIDINDPASLYRTFTPVEAFATPVEDDGSKQQLNATDSNTKFNKMKAKVIGTPSKRALKTDAFTWGYLPPSGTPITAITQTNVNHIFYGGYIKRIMKVENPAFDSTKPASATNPQYIVPELPSLTTTVQDPGNIAVAHPDWSSNTGAKSLAIVKDPANMNGKTDTITWDVLFAYTTNMDTTYGDVCPAKFTVTRTVSDFEEEGTYKTDITGLHYRSNTWTGGTRNYLTEGTPTNWQQKAHDGTGYKWKETYTMTMEFADPELIQKTFGNHNTNYLMYGTTFTVTYEKVTGTAPATNYEKGYVVNDYNVMEQTKVRTEDYLTFESINVYGASTDGVEKIIKTIQGTDVLNTQTNFYVPMTDNGLKFTKVTKIVIIPNMENINFSTTSTHFDKAAYECRWTKANGFVGDTAEVGSRTFTVQTNHLDAPSEIAGTSVAFTLAGLNKNTSLPSAQQGTHRGDDNMDVDWKGYNFVIHFGR